MCAQSTQNFGGLVNSTRKNKKLLSCSNVTLLESENHTIYLTKAIQRLFKNKSFVDCTLSAEQQFIKGHKVILAACSPYFEHLLSKKKNRRPIVLKDVKFEDLKSLLDFMYLGEVVIPSEQLNSFLQTAETLQVKGLTNMFKLKNGAESVNYSVNVENKCKKKKSNCSKKAISSKKIRDSNSCVNEDVFEFTRLPVIKQERESSFTQEVPECVNNLSNLNVADQHNVETEAVVQNEIEIDENDISFPDSQDVINLSDTTSDDYLPCTSQDSLNFSSAVNVTSNADSCKDLNVICKNKLSKFGLTRQEDLNDDGRVNGDNVIVDLQNIGLKVSSYNSDRQGQEPKRNSSGFSTNLDVNTGELTERTSPGIPTIEGPDANNLYSQKIPSTSSKEIPEEVAKVSENSGGQEELLQATAIKADSKGFSDTRKLRNNMHVSKEKLSFQCQLCLESFSERSMLEKHLSVHAEKEKFQCTVCSKCFSKSKDLKIHLCIHAGEKKYQCTVCSKSFAHNGHLNRHHLMHTGEKNFQCTVCSKRFTRSGGLKSHLLIHAREKNFKCTICSKTFTQPSHLKTHLRFHSGERNFQCNVCSKSFTLKGILKTHLRIHTGELNTS